MRDPRRRIPRLLAIGGLTLGAVALAGCSGAEDPGTSPSPSASLPASAEAAPSPSASAAPDESPAPAPSPSATASTPVPLACDELLTAQAVYDFNPNFTLDLDYAPAPSTIGASIDDLDGVACRWVNNTNGSTLDVAVAQLSETDITRLGNELVQSSNSVPTYGDEAYFEVEGGVGTAQVFRGTYWLVAQSVAFYEPGDAAPVVEPALAQLP